MARKILTKSPVTVINCDWQILYCKQVLKIFIEKRIEFWISTWDVILRAVVHFCLFLSFSEVFLAQFSKKFLLTISVPLVLRRSLCRSSIDQEFDQYFVVLQHQTFYAMCLSLDGDTWDFVPNPPQRNQRRKLNSQYIENYLRVKLHKTEVDITHFSFAAEGWKNQGSVHKKIKQSNKWYACHISFSTIYN